MQHTHDVIVIGGGPSGSTAANLVRQAGFSVLVLERLPMLGGMAVTGGVGLMKNEQ